MGGRFQRGKIGGVSAFFAFQDIITSAMAVIITIVILLALDMGEGGGAEESDPAPGELTQQLEILLDELSMANDELREAGEKSASAQLDPGRLRSEIEGLRAELGQLRSVEKASAKDLAEAKQHDGARLVRGELEKQKATNAAAAKQLELSKAEASRSLAAMQRVEAELREKEAQLLAEQAKKNELWLIPDRSKTSKEPVLAVVAASTVTLLRFDQPDKSELHGGRLKSQFADALKGYSHLDQYLVLYFKPSGAAHFTELTEAARTAGFEIGYDAVDEEVAINFQASR